MLIRLRSNITLHLLENAIIKGSPNTNDYNNIFSDKLEPLPEEQATNAKWITATQHFSNGGGLRKHLYTAGSYWNYGIIRAVYAENITAENIKTGLYAYGDGKINYQLNLKDITYNIAKSQQNEPLFKVAYFGKINITNVKIKNFTGETIIKSWSAPGEIDVNNLSCSYTNLFTKTEEEFSCSPI